MVFTVMNVSVTTVPGHCIQLPTERSTSAMIRIACSTTEERVVRVRMKRSTKIAIRWLMNLIKAKKELVDLMET